MKLSNWKTTLAGAISAAATVALGYVQTGVLDPKTLGIAAGIAAIGYLAKDAKGE